MGPGFYSALSHKGKVNFNCFLGSFATRAPLAKSPLLGPWSSYVEEVWPKLDGASYDGSVVILNTQLR